MEHLRTTGCLDIPQIVSVKAPFSNFDFVENNFGENIPLRRVLSQERLGKFSTIIIENIKSVGLSAEDDEDLVEAGITLSTTPLKRISFFKSVFNKPSQISAQSSDDYLGYVILKEIVHEICGRWIVFESITKPVRHDNNYYHAKKRYDIRCYEKLFSIDGNLYCQQNAITNVCAHVALRTCISMVDGHDDYSYRKMNEILKDKKIPFNPIPAQGSLNLEQIKTILNVLNIKYDLQHYNSNTSQLPIPYQKYIYGSIESGLPAMLGFFFGGASGHIIPILGHTFNEDTWTPREQTTYNIGKKTRYVPSEQWVSTYICHDDNFGSHFCIPRNYKTADKHGLFVIAFRPKRAEYSAPKAEAIAADYLYSFANILQNEELGVWNKRLANAIGTLNGWVVLRTIYMTSEQYIEHLKSMRGWKDNEKIKSQITETLAKKLPGQYWWVVEVSLPELFPANKRKLGEIVLDATMPISATKLDLSTFVLARFPEYMYILYKGEKEEVILKDYETGITTHTHIYGVGDEKKRLRMSRQIQNIICIIFLILLGILFIAL